MSPLPPSCASRPGVRPPHGGIAHPLSGSLRERAGSQRTFKLSMVDKGNVTPARSLEQRRYPASQAPPVDRQGGQNRTLTGLPAVAGSGLGLRLPAVAAGAERPEVLHGVGPAGRTRAHMVNLCRRRAAQSAPVPVTAQDPPPCRLPPCRRPLPPSAGSPTPPVDVRRAAAAAVDHEHRAARLGAHSGGGAGHAPIVSLRIVRAGSGQAAATRLLTRNVVAS